MDVMRSDDFSIKVSLHILELAPADGMAHLEGDFIDQLRLPHH